jgi:ACS family hexuronate transporter-like MFS transporter
MSDAVSRRRWAVAALLFLATMLNYLDRQVLSVTAPVLRQTFGMTAQQYSGVVFAFLLAYTLGQSLAGRFMDAVGARRGMGAAMLWWSAAGALHAAASSLFQLSVFRFLLGMGEAGNWPGAVKTVQQWFPPRERAFAMGVFNSGSAIGAVAAPPLIAFLTLRYSWRWAFLLTGALGLLWVFPWLAVNRAPVAAETTDAALRPHWRELLRDRRVQGLMLARFFCDPVWWFYVFWLPDYLSRARGFSLAMIGLFAWVPFLAADLGNLAGGWASGRLVRAGFETTRARMMVMGASAAAMALGVIAAYMPGAAAAIAVVSAVTFGYSAWAANVLTLPADLFGRERVGAATGLTGTAAGLGGMLNTVAVGWLVDHWSYKPAFAVATVLPVAAFAALALLVRPAARIEENTL